MDFIHMKRQFLYLLPSGVKDLTPSRKVFLIIVTISLLINALLFIFKAMDRIKLE
jgi:hypothetical protein